MKEEITSRLVGGEEMQNGLVPHPHEPNKNQEGYLRSKWSQPHTRPFSPEFQCQEDESPQLLAVKTSGDLGYG